MPHIAIALVATLALVLPAGAAASPDRDRWRRPLPGAVIGSFSFDPSAPYEGGRRRGIDLAGVPGAPVRAACSGRVTHVGAVPAWRLGVTLRCGRLVATELGLGSVAVRPGAVVLRGSVVGRLGARGVLRLGARRAGIVHGYVDPQVLLDAESPWGGAPAGRWSPRRPAPPRAVPLRRAVRPAAASAARPVPIVAWAGLTLLAGGAGAVGYGAGRRRARRHVELAPAQR